MERSGPNGEDALGRFRLRGAREFQRRHLADLDAASAKEVQERGTSWGIGELRRNEGTANAKGRAEQLFDGPDSFGGEQALTLARFPAAQVAS